MRFKVTASVIRLPWVRKPDIRMPSTRSRWCQWKLVGSCDLASPLPNSSLNNNARPTQFKYQMNTVTTHHFFITTLQSLSKHTISRNSSRCIRCVELSSIRQRLTKNSPEPWLSREAKLSMKNQSLIANRQMLRLWSIRILTTTFTQQRIRQGLLKVWNRLHPAKSHRPSRLCQKVQVQNHHLQASWWMKPSSVRTSCLTWRRYHNQRTFRIQPFIC